MDEFRVDRSAFSVRSLHDPDDTLEYWLSKTPDERLRAVEMMRQVLYGYDPETARMKKVLTIVRRGEEDE